MKKGKLLVEALQDIIEAAPPQFQKKDGEGDAPKPGNGKGGSDQVIKALRDTDYRDKDAFFKMVQLLKGLAVNSEKDETAKKFMSKVSDALTTAAKSVLGEDLDDLEEAFNAQKMESSIEKTLIRYAKGMKAEGNDGITPMFLGGVITRLDKVSPGLAKWTKHNIKA